MRTTYLVRAVVLQLPDLTVRVLGLVHVKVPLEFKSVFLRKIISFQHFFVQLLPDQAGEHLPVLLPALLLLLPPVVPVVAGVAELAGVMLALP